MLGLVCTAMMDLRESIAIRDPVSPILTESGVPNQQLPRQPKLRKVRARPGAVLVDHRVANDRKVADARSHMLQATLEPLKGVDWRTLMVASGNNDSKSIIAMAFRD